MNSIVQNAIKPPVIAHSQDGSVLLDHIHALQKINVGNAARYEADRLGPYFEAWGRKLQKAHQDEQPPLIKAWLSKLMPSAPEFRDAATLRRIFEGITGQSRSVILSEMAIVPDTALRTIAFHETRTKGGLTYKTDKIPYNRSFFELGFIQCIQDRKTYHPNQNKIIMSIPDSSITFPIFVMDSTMLDAISPYDSTDVLNPLQAMMTAVTHDMLHHMTVSYVTDDIVQVFGHPTFEKPLSSMLTRQFKDAGDEDPHGYELSLVGLHADTWQELRGTPEEERLKAAVSTYFEELGRIASSMRRINPNIRQANSVIDYFSTAAAFALARIVPLNDPLMQKCFDGMESVSTVPGAHFRRGKEFELREMLGSTIYTLSTPEKGDRVLDHARRHRAQVDSDTLKILARHIQ